MISLKKIGAWLTYTEGAISGYLNVKELLKIVGTTLAAGGTFVGLLNSLEADLGNLITDPALAKLIQEMILDGVKKDYVALALTAVVLVGETIRRLKQGQDVKPVTPNPVPPK